MTRAYITLRGNRTAVQYRIYHLTDGRIHFKLHEIKCKGMIFRRKDLGAVVNAVRDVFDYYHPRTMDDSPESKFEEMVR